MDLAKYTIMSALGEDCGIISELPVKTFTASYVIHSLENGIYEDICISDDIQKDIILFDLFVEKGEHVTKFDNGGFGIGAMLIKFVSVEEMTYRMDNMEEFIKVVVS